MKIHQWAIALTFSVSPLLAAIAGSVCVGSYLEWWAAFPVAAALGFGSVVISRALVNWYLERVDL